MRVEALDNDCRQGRRTAATSQSAIAILRTVVRTLIRMASVARMVDGAAVFASHFGVAVSPIVVG